MVSSFEQRVTSFIEQADSADDLLQILRCIPLERVKEFINTEMETKSEDEIRSICVGSCPMDHIVSDDAVQTVLSFVPHQSSNKLVSKRFKRLVTRNEIMTLSQLNSGVLEWPGFIEQKRTALRMSVRGLRVKQNDEIRQLQPKFDRIIYYAVEDMNSVLLKSSRHRHKRMCGSCFQILSIGRRYSKFKCYSCTFQDMPHRKRLKPRKTRRK